jgi:hypothetical protein
MSDTVLIWYDDFLETEPSLEDIENEIAEVTGAISNNRLWLLGSKTSQEQRSHESNICDLEEYLEVLKQMKYHLEKPSKF